MAQVFNFYQPAKPRQHLNGNNLALSVPAAGNTTLLEFPTLGLSRIYFHMDVTVQALDAFRISARATPDAAYDLLYSASTDFTLPKGLILGASGDLTTQGAATSGWFIMDVTGLAGIKIEASANVAGAATVASYVGGA